MATFDLTVITPEDTGNTINAVASYTDGYTFTVKNGETFPITFKAFTQRPDVYTFTPAFGLVMANSKVDVTIRLRVPNFYIQHLEGNTDVARHTSAAASAEEAKRARRRLRNSKKKQSNDDGDHHSDFSGDETASEGYASSEVDDAKGGSKDLTDEKAKKRRKQRDKITSYLRTQISSGVFKVELRVVNTPIGVGVAETVYLARQYPIDYIARKDLERKDKAAFMEQRKREFNERHRSGGGSPSLSAANSNVSSAASLSGGSNQSRSVSPTNRGGRSSSPNGSNVSLQFYDKSKFRPTSAQLSEAIAQIRKNAHSLFEHLWSHAIPHSTHTICCRTMKEDLHTFFAKLISFQERDIKQLNEDDAKLLETIAALNKEADDVKAGVAVLQQRQTLRGHGIPQHFIDDCVPLNGGGSGATSTSSSSPQKKAQIDPELCELVALLSLDPATVIPSLKASDTNGSQQKQYFTPSMFPKVHVSKWLTIAAGVAAFIAAYKTPEPMVVPASWLGTDSCDGSGL